MTSPSDSVHADILLVDDNVLDARATIRATKQLERANTTHHLTDGAEALAFLMDPGPRHPRPDLVLLDVNLPGIGGLEVLRWISTDPGVGDIPVAILTTSDHRSDISRAMEYGASAYLMKPFDLEGWTQIVPRLDRLLSEGSPLSP